MVIGVFLAMILFGPLGFVIARAAMKAGYTPEGRFLSLVYVFFGMLLGLSLFSLMIVAICSLFGFSAAVAADALATSANVGHPGVLTAIGGFMVVIFSAVSGFTGPACAFVAAKFTTLILLVPVLVKLDVEKARLWVPLAAAVTSAICMWPFTTLLTLGL